MLGRDFQRGLVLSATLAMLSAINSSAQAAVVLTDSYYGGLNTYTGQDIIGPANVFDIQSATISRTNGGNTLEVAINTNYAGVPGTAAADGTGYGALFLTIGANAWNPSGTGPNYSTDVYQPGEWQLAFTMPTTPSGSNGTSDLYFTSGGTVVLSNVYNDPITYPFAGNNGYYFRQGQAVQFVPGANQQSVASGTWTVGTGSLTFDINDGGQLGNNFALAWAMTCANDVIQGQVLGDPGGGVSIDGFPLGVPEPTTWALLIVGFFGVGSKMRKNRDIGGFPELTGAIS